MDEPIAAISGSREAVVLNLIRLPRDKGVAVILAVVVATVVLSLMTDTFAWPQNSFNVARNFAYAGIIALGMTVAISSGGIDLRRRPFRRGPDPAWRHHSLPAAMDALGKP